MSLPQVIHENPTQVLDELKAAYEASTEKTLYPAQIEQLIINLIAYRETLLRTSINDAARQNLARYARSPMLEYLGELVNTYRLPAQFAKTTLEFSLSLPLVNPTLIPKGTRIQAANGAIFASVADAWILAGQTSVQVKAQADTAGPEFNGFLPGTIKEPFDTLQTGLTVTNLTTSSGGALIEDIERFRVRVLLAMNQPSAGSSNAYRYIALTADSHVVDVSVQIVAPGWVRLAVLTDGDSAEIVANVDQAVRADDSRPLTDRVDVVAAEAIAAPILVTITPRKGALVATLLQSAQAVLEAHRDKLKNTLGYDLVASELSAKIQDSGAIKRVGLIGADVPIEPHQYAVMSWPEPAFLEAELD
ncbi:baseplate protein [bacterium (Candidatus Blackallbacteria) CG13_big_fil_rev_8_21_14_2_50_49_14]|nr:MAG: baseplate protein [bacterium (Candidatus Blackallbacteria) CG18_big_fil_WC_8_21_14_2_50_49_26]PIW46656.1 MAG: baseplate protein [bacterium (Candidatus Blackallbacteria) CG13_big_fil_rev_8_21_14_2_50_49_14]